MTRTQPKALTQAQRAVFLDRDGVLNHVVWRGGKPASPRTVEELAIDAEALPALAALKAAGYRLFAVTNQPDVRRGLMRCEDLAAIHRRLADTLPLDDISVCVHDDRDACGCRKPKPGMLFDLARRWGVDLKSSWMIGDQDRDIACARSAGSRGLLIAKDYNSGKDADHVAEGLAALAQFILHHQPAPDSAQI